MTTDKSYNFVENEEETAIAGQKWNNFLRHLCGRPFGIGPHWPRLNVITAK